MSNQKKVYLVTDSGSDIPHGLAEEVGIRVVPLSINFETETLLDSVDITPEQYVQRLRTSDKLPSTAQPTVDQFAEAFQTGLDANLDVLCITISSGLSGTINAARLAAEQVGDERIRIVDSRAATMQQGWTVIETARAIEGGASLDEAVAVAEATIPKSHCFAVLQTLDYAYKGGRIGRASHMVGSALGIKPVVGFDDVLVPFERVRTWKRATNRAIELASSQGEVLDIAVLHSDNIEDARKVEQELASRFPNASIFIDWAGPTITTYAGPGAIGIMVRTA